MLFHELFHAADHQWGKNNLGFFDQLGNKPYWNEYGSARLKGPDGLLLREQTRQDLTGLIDKRLQAICAELYPVLPEMGPELRDATMRRRETLQQEVLNNLLNNHNLTSEQFRDASKYPEGLNRVSQRAGAAYVKLSDHLEPLEKEAWRASAASDAFGGVINFKTPAGFGHNAGYWDNGKPVSMELTAELAAQQLVSDPERRSATTRFNDDYLSGATEWFDWYIGEMVEEQ